MRNFLIFLGAGVCTGLVSTCFATNADTLETLLNDQKEETVELLTTTYEEVKSDYTQKLAPTIGTTMYQALNCLGVITNPEVVTEVETKKTQIENNVLEDVVKLQAQIQRYDLGLRTDFENLKKEILSLTGKYTTMITTYKVSYQTKKEEVLNDFKEYAKENEVLVGGLADKINLLQTLFNQEILIDKQINEVTKKYGATTGIQKTLNDTKNIVYANLQIYLDKEALKSISRNRSLTGFEAMVNQNKIYILNMFRLDADYFVKNIFENYYTMQDYLYAKEKLKYMKDTFYVNEQLNCQSLLTTELNLTMFYNNVKNKMDPMVPGLDKAMVDVTSGKIINKIILDHAKGHFIGFYQKYTKDFKDLIKSNTLASTVQEQTQGQITSVIDTAGNIVNTPSDFTFTKNFKKGEQGEGVKILQQLLKNLGFYFGEIDGVHSVEMIRAIYKFQTSEGLLKGYENKPAVRGYMGPATLKALNAKLQTVDLSVTKVTSYTNFSFTVPYKQGESSEGIKILQKLLKAVGVFNGLVDGKFGSDTKDAIYQFQVRENLLVGYENKPAVRGYMGPATRKALNAKLQTIKFE